MEEIIKSITAHLEGLEHNVEILQQEVEKEDGWLEVNHNDEDYWLHKQRKKDLCSVIYIIDHAIDDITMELQCTSLELPNPEEEF